MPAVQPIQLVDAILDAIHESGEIGMLTSAVRTHPRKFLVSGSQGNISLWVYAWTLTHGGRPQLKDEYRIQMTSVHSPLEINPEGPTILIGYEQNLRMFAGFDLLLHKTFTTGSPSVQINITAIHNALQQGMDFHRKENNEIAVAIRPDQFMTYVYNAQQLHKSAEKRNMLDMLQKATTLEKITLPELEKLTTERRRIVQTVSRLSRSANFRDKVLSAYDKRCAVTRMQLRLVDAAHILPVAALKSLDDVRNGIALSPTYHRAFDVGLIYLDENYNMRINSKSKQKLINLNLHDGLQDFIDSLGKIHLPPDKNQWPDLRIISKANRYRQI